MRLVRPLVDPNWLLVKGVNAQRWKEQASAAGSVPAMIALLTRVCSKHNARSWFCKETEIDMKTRRGLLALTTLIVVAAVSVSAFAQARATLRGVISDEFSAAIVGATVTLTDTSGRARTATTNAEGTYTLSGLTPGKYTVHAVATGFAVSEDAQVDLAANRREPLNITLKIRTIESQVKVNGDTPVSTGMANNANQQVITGKDLDALPDDPDDLVAALLALAGPTIGPNGGQIFIDGFSGGNIPPKNSILAIRINQNVFAPENDQPSARIDLITRAGTDKVRGGLNLNFQDESLNSRNPFALSSSKRSSYQQRQFGGSISGPIVKKKASFFIDVNRNETDDNELIRATILDPAFNIVQIGEGFLLPRRNTNFSPRLDYAINPHNQLIVRYNFFRSSTNNQGVGGFSLASRGYNSATTNQNVQLRETAIINATTINETRFQFSHGRNESLGNSSIPVLSVSGAFNDCAAINVSTSCSQIGHVINENRRWELNNFTEFQKGIHTFRFGGRVRSVHIDDTTPNNFGGNWVFTGGFGASFDANNNPITGSNIQLSSIERYRRTALIQARGLSAQQAAYCGIGSSVADCIRKRLP